MHSLSPALALPGPLQGQSPSQPADGGAATSEQGALFEAVFDGLVEGAAGAMPGPGGALQPPTGEPTSGGETPAADPAVLPDTAALVLPFAVPASVLPTGTGAADPASGMSGNPGALLPPDRSAPAAALLRLAGPVAADQPATVAATGLAPPAAPSDPAEAANAADSARPDAPGRSGSEAGVRTPVPPLSDRAAQDQMTIGLGPVQTDPALPGSLESSSFADLSAGDAASGNQPAEIRRSGADTTHHPHRTGAEGPPPAERQIVSAIVSSGSGRTEILLEPQDLGRVRLSLEGNETGLVVTIQAERSDTADLLRRNADLLLQEFREAGYADLSFTFSDRGEPAEQAPRPEEETLSAGPEAGTAAPPVPIGPGARGNALLDLRL